MADSGAGFMPSSGGFELVTQLHGWVAHHLSWVVLMVLGCCWVAHLSLVAGLAGLAGLIDLAGFAGFAGFTRLAGSLLGLYWV